MTYGDGWPVKEFEDDDDAEPSDHTTWPHVGDYLTLGEKWRRDYAAAVKDDIEHSESIRSQVSDTPPIGNIGKTIILAEDNVKPICIVRTDFSLSPYLMLLMPEVNRDIDCWLVIPISMNRMMELQTSMEILYAIYYPESKNMWLQQFAKDGTYLDGKFTTEIEMQSLIPEQITPFNTVNPSPWYLLPDFEIDELEEVIRPGDSDHDLP